MISYPIISCSFVSIYSLGSIGPLNLLCCIGEKLGSSAIDYLPGILPTLSKEMGNMVFKSSMLLMGFNGLGIKNSCSIVFKWGHTCFMTMQRGTVAVGDSVIDMFLWPVKCVFWWSLCWIALLWQSTLWSPSSVQAPCEIITSFLVLTTKKSFSSPLVCNLQGLLSYVLAGYDLHMIPQWYVFQAGYYLLFESIV